MRTKGKVKAKTYMSPPDSWRIADKDGETVVSVGRGKKAKANAQHLAYCWNAFEKGGLVQELVKALEIGIERLDMGNKEGEETEYWEKLRDTLARYEKEIGNG